MREYILITNNPLVEKDINNNQLGENINISLKKVETLNDVMIRTRDMIHKSYFLISHPLAGSVKPAQNPYRSIIIKKGEALDYRSLKMIEKANQKLEQFKANKINSEYPPDILEDYQVIDYSLIASGIKSL